MTVVAIETSPAQTPSFGAFNSIQPEKLAATLFRIRNSILDIDLHQDAATDIWKATAHRQD